MTIFEGHRVLDTSLDAGKYANKQGKWVLACKGLKLEFGRSTSKECHFKQP